MQTIYKYSCWNGDNEVVTHFVVSNIIMCWRFRSEGDASYNSWEIRSDLSKSVSKVIFKRDEDF